MTYVLVLVVAFASGSGVDADTHFYDFDSESACRAARDSIAAGLLELEGTLGREVFAQCHAKK